MNSYELATNSLVSLHTEGEFIIAKPELSGISRIDQKRSPEGVTYEAKVAGTPARLVAKMSQSEGTLFLLDKGRETQIAKYYLAHIKSYKGDDLNIQSYSAGLIKVNSSNSAHLPINSKVAIAIDSQGHKVDQVQLIPTMLSSPFELAPENWTGR